MYRMSIPLFALAPKEPRVLHHRAKRKTSGIDCFYGMHSILFEKKTSIKTVTWNKPNRLFMPGTFSQIYLQFVFAVQGRQSLIPKQHKEELHKFITALVQARAAKMLAVHCMPDHLHLFVGIRPAVFIPDFVKEIKVESNNFIKEKGWVGSSFHWQEGYGVFSYGHSQLNAVCRYIFSQESHHQKKTFREEYHAFLQLFAVPYEERFLFDFLD